MNPATPGPLTVLLVPPDGDTALLADEAGCGRVPMALPSALPGTWFAPSRIDGDISGLPGRALLLVHEGAPVLMSCHRVLDLVAVGEPGTDRMGFPKPLVAFVNGGFGLTFAREGRLMWNARDVFGTTTTLTTPTPIPATDDGPPFVLALAAIYVSQHPGARVVLLRDGREVGS